MSGLERVPDEALLVVFAGLSPRALLACAGACASWRALLDDDNKAWWEDVCVSHVRGLPEQAARQYLAAQRARQGCSWRQLCLSRGMHTAWRTKLVTCKVAHRVSTRQAHQASPGRVTALLSPPWLFLHQWGASHFFVKLMRVYVPHGHELSSVARAYRLEASTQWPRYGLTRLGGLRDHGMEQYTSENGSQLSDAEFGPVVALQLPLIAVGSGSALHVWHAEQAAPLAVLQQACGVMPLEDLAFETSERLADPGWLPSDGLRMAACSGALVRVWQIANSVAVLELRRDVVPEARRDTRPRAGMPSPAPWQRSRWPRAGSAPREIVFGKPVWRLAQQWQGAINGGLVMQLRVAWEGGPQLAAGSAAAAHPLRYTQGRLYILIKPAGGAAPAGRSDRGSTAGDAAVRAALARLQGAPPPDLGFSEAGPANVRPQALECVWAQAVPGACNLAVADGAAAVAADSGLLLLLDAATGALSGESPIPIPATSATSRSPSPARGSGRGSEVAVTAHVPAQDKEAKCTCGHPAVLHTRPWQLEPRHGGRLTRRVLHCGRKPAELRCDYLHYLD
ncbi:hypothetical protein WJX81_005343 [Elliptochloris bilobata]|uniref:F-box domain-containing protein n=1 Tax=Elliptochloris bilobata TaxID=381761 RepID=A0AAW1S959_9CHLO